MVQHLSSKEVMRVRFSHGAPGGLKRKGTAPVLKTGTDKVLGFRNSQPPLMSFVLGIIVGFLVGRYVKKITIEKNN